MGYSEILDREKGATCAGLLIRAAAYFANVERFNRPLSIEWACRQAFASNRACRDALAPSPRSTTLDYDTRRSEANQSLVR